MSKTKNFSFHNLAETSAACARFIDQNTSNLFEFIEIASSIEKELKDKDPEELLMPREVNLAFSKAVHEVFVKTLREIAKDTENTKEVVLMLLNKSRPILWIFAFMLKSYNGKIKIEKNLISHVKEVVLWVLSKDNHEFFIPDFFIILTLVNEIVINKKKTDLKDVDLAQISNFLLTFLGVLVKSETFSHMANCIIPFCGVQKSLSLFSTSPQEICNTDLVHYTLLSIEILSRVDLSHLSEFISTSLHWVLVYLLEIPDFRNRRQSTNTELAIEKYLVTLRLFRLLCSQNSKADLARNQLKSNSENIKNLFFYTLENYLHYYMTCTSIYFEEDEGAIGKLLKILLDIMNGALAGSELEGYPLIFCSVILQNVKKI